MHKGLSSETLAKQKAHSKPHQETYIEASIPHLQNGKKHRKNNIMGKDKGY
jgi:hypothetical protein